MALPILESPKYTVEIPSTKKAIEYRPFLVKEEKILLMAQESQESREMLNAMKDIIRACTFEKVDVDAVHLHLNLINPQKKHQIHPYPLTVLCFFFSE